MRTPIPKPSRIRIGVTGSAGRWRGWRAALGEDRDPVTGHRQEAAGDVVGELLAGPLDAYLAGLGEQAEQWGVPGHHAEFALDGARDDHLGVAGPHLLLDGYEIDVQLLGHGALSCRAGRVSARV